MRGLLRNRVAPRAAKKRKTHPDCLAGVRRRPLTLSGEGPSAGYDAGYGLQTPHGA